MPRILRSKRKAEYGDPMSVPMEDMLFEIAGQSNAISPVLDQTRRQLNLMDDALFKNADRIILSGCGDSFFAAQAAEYAFNMYAGLPINAVEALEFSRYQADFISASTLFFGISNSGKVARTVEAVINARFSGAKTIAVTGNTNSWLAQEADSVLDQSVRLDGLSLSMPSVLKSEYRADKKERATFGLVNFLASLVTLYSTAIHIGELRGHLSKDSASKLHGEIQKLSGAIDETVELCKAPTEKYVQQLVRHDNFFVLGAGPSYATSQFYAAKCFEISRVNAVGQALEEWAHEQFFVTTPASHVLFVAPPGLSTSRILELVNAANRVGATTCVVTDSTNEEIVRAADVHLPVSERVSEVFSPIVYCVPGELLATYLGLNKGRSEVIFDSKEQYETNLTAILESRILERTLD